MSEDSSLSSLFLFPSDKRIFPLLPKDGEDSTGVSPDETLSKSFIDPDFLTSGALIMSGGDSIDEDQEEEEAGEDDGEPKRLREEERVFIVVFSGVSFGLLLLV
jgi:hypothetical protein